MANVNACMYKAVYVLTLLCLYCAKISSPCVRVQFSLIVVPTRYSEITVNIPCIIRK